MKILLADDSMTAQNMGKKILTDAGYEVVAVSNGAAAVKKIAEQRPDVAVLDVYMPGYTGLEVCERLKTAQDTTHMPVLLTVGRMEPFKPEEGNRVKADGIIIKPFEASDLLAAIQKIEQRIRPARPIAAAGPSSDPTTVYEKTQKIQIPYAGEFKDASYEEWKVTAPGHAEEGEPQATVQAVPAFSVPENMQATPAFGMDELEVVPAAEADPQRVTQMMNPPAAAPRPTAQIEHKTEVVSSPPAPDAQPDRASKSTSGVWRALDKARDWFGGGDSEPAPTANPESAAFAPVTDLPEEKLEEAFFAAESKRSPQTPTYSSFEVPAPQPATPPAEASPVPEHVKTLHELAYEKSQSYGAHAMDSAQPSAPAPFDDLVVHTSAPVGVTPTRDPRLDVTPPVDLDDITADPNLEPTILSRDASPTIVAADPKLVTDASELVTAFPTKFGVANPDDVPVAMASTFPHLYADTAAPAEIEVEHGFAQSSEELKTVDSFERPAEKPMQAAPSVPGLAKPAAAAIPGFQGAGKSGWVAEEAPLEHHESDVKLHDEMHQAFAAGPEGDGEVTEIELIDPGEETSEEASAVGSATDPELAAAMAAAVGAEVAPAVGKAVSESVQVEAPADEEKQTAMVADIVQRVVDMMKPELIRRISSELGKKK